jgi:protein TonB
MAVLVWLPTAALTTDAQLSGRQSVLSVAFVDAPSEAQPEPVVHVQIDVAEVDVRQPPPIEPCPVPIPRTETPPPSAELAMAMLDPLETITPARDTPRRVTSRPPQIEVEPIAPAPRRAPARPRASIATPAMVGSVERTSPKPLDNPLPEYPIEALRRALHGRVTLRVKVSAAGNVSDLAVAQSSGYLSFDEAALEAVRDWRFEPARRFGRPVASTVLLPIRFMPR